MRWAGNSELSAWYKCLIEILKVEIMKHKLNRKNQAGTIDDNCKNVENLMSSQPIANAFVGCSFISSSKANPNIQLALFY